MLSSETRERMQAIKRKVEEVGEVMGIPSGEAAVLVAVDTMNQMKEQRAKTRDIWQAIWKGLGVIKAEIEIIFGWKK